MPSTSEIWTLYRTAENRFGGRDYDDESTPTTSTFTTPNKKVKTPLPALPNITEFANAVCGPQDSADKLLLVAYAKKFEELRLENERLRRIVAEQDRRISRMKKQIGNGSECESSESQSKHEKSTTTSSTSAGLPIGRVTPQKRGTSKMQSPRMNNLLRTPVSSSTSENSANGSPVSRRPSVRRSIASYFEADSQTANATFTVGHGDNFRNERLQTVSRTITSSASPQSSRVESNPVKVLRRSNTTAEIQENTPSGSNVSHPIPLRRNIRAHHSSMPDVEIVQFPAGQEDTPAYHLRLKRPEFIRNLERRQSDIRLASAEREKIENIRKEALKALSRGEVEVKDVQEVLFIDPTEIRAFSNKEMRNLTKRNLLRTNEVRKELQRQRLNQDHSVNRLMSKLFSARTQQKIHRSPSLPML